MNYAGRTNPLYTDIEINCIIVSLSDAIYVFHEMMQYYATLLTSYLIL